MQRDGLVHRAQVVVNSKSLIGWIEQVVAEDLCSLDLLIADPICVEDAKGVLKHHHNLEVNYQQAQQELQSKQNKKLMPHQN